MPLAQWANWCHILSRKQQAGFRRKCWKSKIKIGQKLIHLRKLGFAASNAKADQRVLGGKRTIKSWWICKDSYNSLCIDIYIYMYVYIHVIIYIYIYIYI